MYLSVLRFCIALQDFISEKYSKEFIRGAEVNIEIQIIKTGKILCSFI